MDKDFNVYVNYGCLGKEKRKIYTAGMPEHTAVTHEIITCEIPEGWKSEKNEFGDITIISPWGWKYNLNELLGGNEYPYFKGFDKEGNEFRIRLKYNES